MDQKLFNVILFTAGAAVGSLVTWKVVKTKYERIAQEEINSVKEAWARMARENDEDDEWGDEDEEEYYDEWAEDPDSCLYHTYGILCDQYNTTSDEAENDEEGEGDDEAPLTPGPYVIKPEEFGDNSFDHACYCLSYYADGVLADDWDEELDIDELIGRESLEHFGDYATDIVHVRNENRNADYEIVKDPRNYADVVKDDPLLSNHAD